MRGRYWTAALCCVVASVGLGCTVKNGNYCENAPHFNCALADAAVDLPAGQLDGFDVAVETADVTGERAPEVKPECTGHAECTMAARPICDTARGLCVPCTKDTECKVASGQDQPGLCLDGTCPTRAEVIVVNIGGTGCSNSQGGTPEVPLCDMAGVRARLMDSNERRRVVVVRGSDASPWSLTVTPGRVVIVGQPMARVVLAGAPAISLVGDVDVALRRFEITASGSGASFAGISVGPRATVDLQDVTVSSSGTFGVDANEAVSIRLNRVTLIDNGTGLRVRQTPFRVTNTVIARSKVAGAVLDAPPQAMTRFQNNTLHDNAVPLTCGGNYAASALLVYPATDLGLAATGGCIVRNSNMDLPQFSTEVGRAYRLTVASPCVGKGDPTDFPPDDIDGEPRPMGAASDCGADEFKE